LAHILVKVVVEIMAILEADVFVRQIEIGTVVNIILINVPSVLIPILVLAQTPSLVRQLTVKDMAMAILRVVLSMAYRMAINALVLISKELAPLAVIPALGAAK
jgi:hypothetical protein